MGEASLSEAHARMTRLRHSGSNLTWSLIAARRCDAHHKRAHLFDALCWGGVLIDLPQYRLYLAFRNSLERRSMIRFRSGIAEGTKPRS